MSPPDSPRISVIIPTLQEGKLLRRSLGQFTRDIRRANGVEVIVSDGGSTDESLAIARELADVVIECDRSAKQNISVGRNAGARAARGETLVFVNADTFIDRVENFFQTVVAAVHEPGVAGATCKVLVHADQERLSDALFHGFYNWYFSLLNTAGIGMGRGECQVVRKTLFDEAGGYDESIAAGEDFEFFVRLRRRGRIAFLRNLTVRESPRRYRKYGYVWITLLWFANAVAVLVLQRSVMDHWKPVR